MLSNAIKRIFESKHTTKSIPSNEDPEVEDDNNIKDNNSDEDIYDLSQVNIGLCSTSANSKEKKKKKSGVEEPESLVDEENEQENENENEQEQETTNIVNDTSNTIKIIKSPHEGKKGKAWIVAFDQEMTWNLSIKESEAKLRRFSEATSSPNSSNSTLSCDEVQIPYSAKRVQKAIEHNEEIRKRRIIREQIQRERKEFQRLSTQQKLYLAENRRQQMLLQKSNILNDIQLNSSNNNTDMNLTKNMSPSKLTLASITREKILQRIRERAGNNVDYARSIAIEKRNFDNEHASIRKNLLNERLKNAHLRRQAALNAKRLNLIQHLEYTKSVMENKKTNHNHMSQSIAENLNAAEYRRSLNLEEIQSKAKHHNLMVKTKLKYANAVLETKLLEESLRTDRKHENAYDRRIAYLRNLSTNEIRQNKVSLNLQKHNDDIAKLKAKMNKRLAEASSRRTQIILARKNAPGERSLFLKTRKQTNETKRARTMLKQIQSKIKDAEYRRLSLIESRRRKCSSINWKKKMAKERAEQITVRSCEENKRLISEKLALAKQQRERFHQSVFAVSLRDRVLRFRQSANERETKKKRSSQKKIFSSNIRQSAEFMTRLDKVIEAQNRAIKAASRRKALDHTTCHKTKQQLFKRMLAAEIRKKEQIDARMAFSLKVNARHNKKRSNADVSVSDMLAAYHQKLKNAEERRNSYLSNAAFSAVRNQEKIRLAREKEALQLEIKKITYSEKLARSEMRRRHNAQRLSEKARSFLERHYQRRNEKLERAKKAIEEKQIKASKIREENQSKKIAKAQDFSKKRELVGERNREQIEKARVGLESSVDDANERREIFLNTIRERAGLHVKNVENKLKESQIRNNQDVQQRRKSLEEKLENATARRENMVSLSCSRSEAIGNMTSLEQCTSAV